MITVIVNLKFKKINKNKAFIWVELNICRPIKPVQRLHAQLQDSFFQPVLFKMTLLIITFLKTSFENKIK